MLLGDDDDVDLNLESGCAANNTAVHYKGELYVSSGAVVSNTEITSGGEMFLHSGGVHRGSMQIGSGASVSAYRGAKIDFSLADKAPGNDYLINDLSLVRGTPTYTITVSADQADGCYKLAQGADSFTGTITIGTKMETYGTLTVNEAALIYNGKQYSLTLNGENLQLFISPPDSEAPVLEITGNATAWTNKNVVLTAVASDSPSGISSVEYSFNNMSWTEGESVSVSKNGTVYFRATDNAGNITTQSVVVNRIDKTAPVRGKITLKQTDQNSVKVTISGFTDNVKIARYDVYLAGKKIGSSANGNYVYQSASRLTGTLNFSVKAIDTVGNISAAASAALTVKPAVTVVGRATEKTTSIRWAAASMSGGVKQYEIRVSGMSKTFKSKTNRVTLKKLTAGNHTVTIYATNKAKQRVLVASGAPLYVNDITAPKGGKVKLSQRNQNSVLVSISGFTDNVKVARYDIYLNGRKVGSTTSNSYVYNGKNLAGSLKFSVRAFDAAGNAAKDKKATIKIKDAPAPNRVVGLRVVGKANEKVTTLSWNRAGDNVGVTQYEIRVSGMKKVYKSKTTSITIKKLSAGAHTFTVTAIDKAKNRSVVSQSVKFTVLDGTAPKGGKVKLSQRNQNSVLVSISGFTDNVKVARYDIYLNGRKVGSTTSNSYVYNGKNLAGSLKFSVMAVDAAGNVSKAKKATLKIKAINTSNQSKTVCSGEQIKVVAATVNKTISGITDGVKDVNGITGSAANDIITFQKDRDFNLLSDISLGSGDDKLIIPTAESLPGIAFESGAGVSFGAGNDTLDLGSDVCLGYSDRMVAEGFSWGDLVAGTLNFGTGNDTFRMREASECSAKSISFGDGNDTLQLDYNAWLDLNEGDGKILFGAGNDKLILGDSSELEASNTLTLDFGSGTDTMTFNGDVEVYADQLVITGLENITGTGSLVLNNGCTLDDETKAKFEKAGISVTLA